MSRLGVGGALSLLPLVLLCCSGLDGAADGLAAASHRWQSSNHTNNWAVLVCTSRFWFNYRHMANALSVYHTAKRLGEPRNLVHVPHASACQAPKSTELRR